MADGEKNAVNWDRDAGYDEPPRDSDGANHMMTDYDGPSRVKTGFNDRRTSSMDSAAAMVAAAYRSGPAYG